MTDILVKILTAPSTGPDVGMEIELQGSSQDGTYQAASPSTNIPGILCFDLESSRIVNTSLTHINVRTILDPWNDTTNGLCYTVRNETTTDIPVDVFRPDFTISDPLTATANGGTVHFTINGNNTQPLPGACCVAEGTQVRLADSGQLRRIDAIRPGVSLIAERGQPVVVRRVIEFTMPVTDFVRLAEENDSKDALLIRRGHPILDSQGRERQCQDIEGAEAIVLEDARRVYTLVTDRRAFIETASGHRVGTWSERAWSTERKRGVAPHIEL